MRSDLDDRIARLKKLRDELNNCFGCGCLSLYSCRPYNPSDKLAKQGPSRRLLICNDKVATHPLRLLESLGGCERREAFATIRARVRRETL